MVVLFPFAKKKGWRIFSAEKVEEERTNIKEYLY